VLWLDERMCTLSVGYHVILEDVCCGLKGECAHCQLVTMLSWKMYAVVLWENVHTASWLPCYPGRCMLWFYGRMCTLPVGYHVILEDVCCGLKGECANCQLVNMFSSFLNLKNINPFLYSVYILMLESSFRRICILKERSQK
jgi:ABC-type uncharacterized transport system permease subunit